MNRIAALTVVAALVLVGCSGATAPTPQIIYVTPAPTTALAPTPQIIYVTPAPNACTVTWLYDPPSWMTKLVASLVTGQDVITGTPIDSEPVSPCEKAQWLAGTAAGVDCQGTVCLGINDTGHGRYDRGLEGNQPTATPAQIPTAAASVQCAIQRDGPPWDGPELIVTGPEGSCRSLQVALSQMAVWDTVAPVYWSNGDPVFLCGGTWNGLGIDVYYSDLPNSLHGDYGAQVCAALSLPGR